MSLRTETLPIEGMTCGHCVRAVREALERLPGVEVEAVEIGRAVVRYDDAQTRRADLAARVAEAGYAVVEDAA
jgi:copper chaperone CopZ